jgi:anti-sigma factor RsiW
MRWRRRRPNDHDLTCQQAVALVTAYLDGELTPDARARFEAHLGDCDMCGEHVKQIQVTIQVAGRVRDEDLDPLAREDLMDLYRRWRDVTA